MSSEEINENQFVTLTYYKSYHKITDKQDDDTLLGIIKSANNEVKKQIVTVVDNILDIEGTKFFDRAQDAALVFCTSYARRDINQMYDEAEKLLNNFNSQMETLLGDIRATAPKRTSLEVVSRTIPFEDDYFAERHLP